MWTKKKRVVPRSCPSRLLRITAYFIVLFSQNKWKIVFFDFANSFREIKHVDRKLLLISKRIYDKLLYFHPVRDTFRMESVLNFTCNLSRKSYANFHLKINFYSIKLKYVLIWIIILLTLWMTRNIRRTWTF